MFRKTVLSLLVAETCVFPASAHEGALRLVLSCTGADVKMEVYLPEKIWGRSDAEIVRLVNADQGVQIRHLTKALANPVIGYYALDLREYGKGKPLEPVRVSMSADGAEVIVSQHTRGLPPTRIPVGGGVVDFDRRYASAAKCAAFLDK